MIKPRGVLIAGNWKMNLGPKETDAFFQVLTEKANQTLDSRSRESWEKINLRAVLFPPAISFIHAKNSSQNLPFSLEFGSQNTHGEKKGAFTGEISAPMLKDLGIHWSLVGHSERRQFFGETPETAQKRVLGLLEQGMNVIFCVGETRHEREEERTEAVLKSQLQSTLQALALHYPTQLPAQLVIAYEPVWAIGTGLTATPEQAQQAHEVIRAELVSSAKTPWAQSMPLLYGGSVTPENIQALLRCEAIDGALVGGASLKAESFLSLLRLALELPAISPAHQA
ncbi:MAG: triose-phosphate isomerase [Bdellovibrionia bacterium]